MMISFITFKTSLVIICQKVVTCLSDQDQLHVLSSLVLIRAMMINLSIGIVLFQNYPWNICLPGYLRNCSEALEVSVLCMEAASQERTNTRPLWWLSFWWWSGWWSSWQWAQLWWWWLGRDWNHWQEDVLVITRVFGDHLCFDRDGAQSRSNRVLSKRFPQFRILTAIIIIITVMTMTMIMLVGIILIMMMLIISKLLEFMIMLAIFTAVLNILTTIRSNKWIMCSHF